MTLMEICVLILTIIAVLFLVVAVIATIFLLKFMRTMKTTMQSVNETVVRTQAVIENLDQSVQIVNRDLPVITNGTSQIVANVSGITGKIDHGVGVGMSVLEKTPVSALYTIVGIGRTLAKKFGGRKNRNKA